MKTQTISCFMLQSGRNIKIKLFRLIYYKKLNIDYVLLLKFIFDCSTSSARFGLKQLRSQMLLRFISCLNIDHNCDLIRKAHMESKTCKTRMTNEYDGHCRMSCE